MRNLPPAGPARRHPAEHQRQELRDELHKAIDRIIDSWPHIDHQAQTMSGGYPGNTLSDGGGHGHNDTALERAIAMRTDLAARSRTWLRHLDDLIATTRIINAAASRLLPLTDDELEQARNRKNTVDVCAKCNQPAPKVHRVDGKAYCATTCYYQVYRADRRANMQTA